MPLIQRKSRFFVREKDSRAISGGGGGRTEEMVREKGKFFIGKKIRLLAFPT